MCRVCGARRQKHFVLVPVNPLREEFKLFRGLFSLCFLCVHNKDLSGTHNGVGSLGNILQVLRAYVSDL